MTKTMNVEISPKHSLSFSPWSKLTKTEKNREIVRLAHQNRGRAVTLNLSPDFANYLMGNEAPMRQVGKRTHAELKKLDLHRLPILLVLEATKGDRRPHLHGAFIANGVPEQAIQKAMRRAVGYVPGRSGSRQFFAKEIFAPDGWSNYLLKDKGFTQKLLSLADDRRLWWVSHSMTRLVRDHYEAVRARKLQAANNNISPASTGS
ncbi:hypothetical protein LHP98_12955 [Rhodobacter sp. Har01]|uniref:hypothetical protein n=1 Tax=Rhodobacter sp. Har01 TaxID=2883999 RepID=UPI001D0937C8|nr:hypothetical protein [Rhodobacter sp. Har01]MCB6179034.1 hypothetical protein [Rhodobacter sp. Har01]